MELLPLPTLQDPLQNEIDPKSEFASEIIGKLWPGESTSDWKPDWRPFLAYYTAQCRSALVDRGENILLRKHQHVLSITNQFKELAPRDIIKEDLKELFTSKSDREKEILNNSVDLAARLYLMVNIGEVKFAVSSGTSWIWREGNLRDFISSKFSFPQKYTANITFQKSFNAYGLRRIAGIKFEWTNNLADHLRMTDDKTVEIFHHASFLKHVRHQLFPDGLLEETLRTLSLLFPPHDPDTEKFFQGLETSIILDKHLAQCKQLQLEQRRIETYTFWHDRLILLAQAFDQSRPATLSQWWHDRRNGVQWYTFWVAIVVLFLTIFFGMVQSVEGALQVYKAYHPSRP